MTTYLIEKSATRKAKQESRARLITGVLLALVFLSIGAALLGGLFMMTLFAVKTSMALAHTGTWLFCGGILGMMIFGFASVERS
jgi:hypothetical protein